MIDTEIAALLAYAGRLDQRVHRTLADPQQAAATITDWQSALADVPAVLADAGWDAAHSVRRYYEQRGGDRSAQFRAIEPHDLLAAWVPHRAELMNRHTDPLPAASPDDPLAWRAELRDTRAAVATGHASPAQYRAEIDAAGQQRLAALMSGVGRLRRRVIPEEAARQLAPFRRSRAAYEAALAEGQPDALAHRCTWCHAEAGQPCRSGFRRRGKGRTSRTTPHPCRIDAARAAQEQTP